MAVKTTIAELLVEIGMDSSDAEKSADRIAKKLDKVKDAGEGAEKGVDKTGDALERFTKVGDFAGKTADKIGAALLGVAGVVGGLAREVLTTGGTFEKLEAQLKTATGSAQGAKQALDFIRDFTARTPFQLDQVTDAFVKLTNFGLDPTTRNLTAFGDFASAMGKDLDQLIEAVLDATTGEFERLKEFGIKTKQEGDKVKFTFRGITTEVAKNAKDIQEFLIGVAETNFGGAMAERMETLGGITSNLQDAMAEFFNTVAQTGPLEEFKALVGDLRDAAGGKGGLAEALGRLLTNAIRSVRNLLRGNLIPTLERVLSVIEFVIDNFGKLTALFVAGKLISGVAGLASAFSGLGISIAALTGPIGIASAALVALGITAVKVSQKIRSIPKVPKGPPPVADDVRQQASPETIAQIDALQTERDRLAREGADSPIKADLNREKIANLSRRINALQGQAVEEAAATRRESTADILKRAERVDELRDVLGIVPGTLTSTEQQEDLEVGAQALSEGKSVEEAIQAISAARLQQAETAGELKPKKKRKGRKKKKKKTVTSPTTVSEFFGAAARGELGTIADKTPSPREIEPTVAVDITNNNFSFNDTFQITGTTDPVETGKTVVAKIKEEFDRRLAGAGQQLATNLER